MAKGRGEKIPLYSAFSRPGEKLPGAPGEKQSFLSYIPIVGRASSTPNSPSSTRAVSASPTTSTPGTPADLESGQRGFLNAVGKAAHGGFSKASGSARSLASSVTNRGEEASFFLDTQRVMYFVFTIGVGFFFFFLAILCLPLIVIAPQKFAILFTLGSLCVIASLVIIKGFASLINHFISAKRLPYSVCYFLSLILTLYAALWAGSYLLTLFSAIVQFCSLFALLVSYVPGGVRFLSYLREKGTSAATSVVPGMAKAPQGILPMRR